MTTAGRIIGVNVILVSTAFEALGQLAFKRAANLAGDAGPFAAIFTNYPWITLGFLGFMAEGILWSVALYFLDVSVAHPLGSLVFVVVAILCRIILRERITRMRWAGIFLILAGSVLVAMN